MITYVTGYIEIERSKWSKFDRTFDDYFKSFKPYFKLFDSRFCESDNMIVFIEEKYYLDIQGYIDELEYNVNINVILLSKNDLPKWKYIEREREIMNDDRFLGLLGNRTQFPEHKYPEYTIVNHSKIDMINLVIYEYEYQNTYFSWVDFGFFSNEHNIPTRLIDINKLDKDKINYSLINPVESNDFNIYYTLKYAPEVIGGFWFFGSKDNMKVYQKLYMETFLKFQEMGIADDDQHIVLQCYLKQKELFSLKPVYAWHKVLKLYQKPRLKVVSFCLWGNEKRYTVGLIKNIELCKLYYPEWKCFLYIHKTSVNKEVISSLSKYDNVSIIFKNDNKIRSKRFMLWRMEPILYYPIVEYFISRDIDTRIQPREVLSVDEWLYSGKTLHIMRDHPQHYPKILGGMYGIKSEKLFKENWIDIIEEFYRVNGEEMDDQTFLCKYVYDIISTRDRIIHDEIKKYEGNECLKYPIRYEQNGHFVGCYIYEDESIDIETTNTLKNWLNKYLPERISKDNITLSDKLLFLKTKIDSIYVMHYTKLVSRKRNMIKELKRNLLDKFFNVKWIENFDRETLTDEHINESCVLNPNILNRRMTLAEIANGLAHKYIYQQILQNDNITLVLEDDTIFKPFFIDHLYYIFHNLPKEWDMLCLGGPTEEHTVPDKSIIGSIREKFDSSEIVYYKPKTPAPCTLSCMLHTKHGIKKVLSSQYIERLTAPSDHNLWVVNIDKRIDIYWVQPWISYEGSKTEMFETSLQRGF